LTNIQQVTRKRGLPVPTQFMTDSTSTGTSTGYNLGGTYGSFSIQATYSTARVSALKVYLQGSLNGTNYGDISGSTWDLTSEGYGGLKFVTGKPVSHVRSVLDTLTLSTGSTALPNVDVWVGVAE